jgi:hypothetical protein
VTKLGARGQGVITAGRRLAEFLAGLPAAPGPVAVVTHGGITVDLLRNLFGKRCSAPAPADDGRPVVRHHRRGRAGRRHDRFDFTPIVTAAQVPSLTLSTDGIPGQDSAAPIALRALT